MRQMLSLKGSLMIATTILLGTLGASQAQALHPRLWLRAADVPRLQSLAKDQTRSPLGFVPAEAYRALEQQAQRFLQEQSFTYSVSMPGREGGPAKTWSYTLSDEAPPRHDDYSHYPCWTGLSRALETRIIHLAFAALISQERAYFDKARQMTLHLCRWPGVWTDPSYGNPGACLDTAHLSNAVALFYDWHYTQLSEQERLLLRQALKEKAIAGLRKAIPAYGAEGWPNGFAVLTAALGTCAVALQGEEKEADIWLQESLRWAKEFFDTQGRDGGCMEGPGYGTYGADTLAKFLWVLDSAQIPHTLLQHPFFRTLPVYSISLLCPSDKQHTGFGDCWFVQPFALCMALLARQGHRDANWYLHEIGAIKCRTIEEFLTIGLHMPAYVSPQKPSWNPSRAFVDIGYAALRDGFNERAAFLAFKCGPPERIVGHNHYDHNSFQIHFNGSWIASDPGYTGFFDPPDNKYGRCTFGHNTITLDVDETYLNNMRVPLVGHDQIRLNGGRIVAFHSSNLYDYVKGAATEAYNPSPGGANACIHFWRAGQETGFAQIRGPRPVATEWTQYEFSGVAPEEAAFFCLALQYDSAEGSVWYDDAELLIDGQPLFLPNPGFEEGMTHWGPRTGMPGAGKHEIDEHNAHSGRRSARIDGPGGYYYWKPDGKLLPIKPGQKITARFWAKCSPPQPLMKQALREILFIKPYTFVIRDTLEASAPHTFHYVLHTMGQAKVLGPHQAQLIAPGQARLEAHIFSPAGVNLAAGYFPGAEARGPYLNAATGRTVATTISSVLVARDAEFALANPGFEEGIGGWIIRTAEDCAKNHVVDEQVAHSGKRSGRIDGPKGGYYYTPRFAIAPGQSVRIRFWAKLEGRPDRWACVYWWRADALSGNATGSQPGPQIEGNEWKPYEFVATAPPETAQACVAFNFSAAGHIWIDDVEVQLEGQRAQMPPAQVAALQEGQQGFIIAVDGMRHYVAFQPQMRPWTPLLPKPAVPWTIAFGAHRLTCDGKMACVSENAQGRIIGAWLLDGRLLRWDGKPLTPALASSAALQQPAIPGLSN